MKIESKPFILLFFITVVFAFVLFFSLKLHITDPYLNIVITELAFVLLPSVLFIIFYRLKFKYDIGFKSAKFKYYLLAFVFATISVCIINFLDMLTIKYFPQFNEYLKMVKEMTSFEKHKWFSIIFFVAVLPPFFEELFFRGVILNLLDNKRGMVAIIISSFVFAMFHLNLFAFLQIFLFGLLLGYLYKKSESIFVPMFFHFTINLFTVLGTNYLS